MAEPLPVFKSFVKDSQRWELAAEAATTAAAAQKQDNPDKVTSVSASASTSTTAAAVIAVSYTHLDVYKRQFQSLAAFQ